MTYTKAFKQLVEQIDQHSRDKATGKLVVTNDRLVREIHFNTGQIIYITTRDQRKKHWQRTLEQYFPNVEIEANLELVSDKQLWEAMLLNKGLVNRQISLVQIKAFVRELIVEYLFELSLVKNFDLKWESFSNENSPLPLALGLSRNEFHALMKKVVKNRNEWKLVEIENFNFNFSPKLTTVTSSESLPVSSHYLDGNHTLWDIAAKEQKNVSDITLSLFNLIKENVIELNGIKEENQQQHNKPELADLSKITAFPNTNNLVAIVDDDPEILAFLMENLEARGYQVLAIDEAMHGMSKLMELQPKLILLDTHMPTIDGYSVCKFLRTTSLFTETTIILLTNYDNNSEHEYASFVGANDLVCKPINLNNLIAKVEKYLPLNSQQKQFEDQELALSYA
jgi:CheY-like chemotaxis protein